MRTILSLAITLSCAFSYAQIPNTLFGLARKNNPEQVFLATMDPISGVVTNLDTNSISTVINLTGASLDPTTNSYHFIGSGGIKTIDLSTGVLINTAIVNNPIADSYFDNFRFNNSDSTLYGLARRYIQATQTGEVYLATINTQTGAIAQISPTSVAQGFAYEGSAIDPYQMVYYFSGGTALMGLDMYNGSIYSNTPITFTTGGTYIGNFAYSCIDTTLYGLIRTNLPNNTYELHLGKINPTTGVVTTISPTSISSGGYSINAGSTIDPDNLIFYYSSGAQLIGVSLITGTIVIQQSYTHDNGCQFFDLMRIQSNCAKAKTALRPDPATASISDEVSANETVQVFPNPASTMIEIQSDAPIDRIEIYNAAGQLFKKMNDYKGEVIQINDLDAGIYFLKATTENQGTSTVRFVKN